MPSLRASALRRPHADGFAPEGPPHDDGGANERSITAHKEDI